VSWFGALRICESFRTAAFGLGPAEWAAEGTN
jgi:hypothetical protein